MRKVWVWVSGRVIRQPTPLGHVPLSSSLLTTFTQTAARHYHSRHHYCTSLLLIASTLPTFDPLSCTLPYPHFLFVISSAALHTQVFLTLMLSLRSTCEFKKKFYFSDRGLCPCMLNTFFVKEWWFIHERILTNAPHSSPEYSQHCDYWCDSFVVVTLK